MSKISSKTIKRTALDQTGTLRYFYNARRDIVGGKLHGNFTTKSKLHRIPPKWEILRIDQEKTKNPLAMIIFDDELRLSIYLKMLPITGIASLINYSQRINNYTRLLQFYQRSCTESCCEDMNSSELSQFSEALTTHIVTEIHWGINIVIILQLKPTNDMDIDIVLTKLWSSLSEASSVIEINDDEQKLLDSITSITVYSNIDEFTKLKNFKDVCDRIIEVKKNRSLHQRLNYILKPTIDLYGQQNEENQIYFPIDREFIQWLELYLFEKYNDLTKLNLRIDQDLPDLLKGRLQRELEKARQCLLGIEEAHENELKQLRKLIIRVRSGMQSQEDYDEISSLCSNSTTRGSMNKLDNKLGDLELKCQLIEHLRENDIEYCDVADLNIETNNTEQSVKELLMTKYHAKIVILSSDKLRQANKNDWNKKYDEMIEKRKHIQQPFVYADFTYSKYKLKEMTICSWNNQSEDQDNSSSTDEVINILLLGESGVGKSTFINAFANYLNFESLEQAEKGKPVVIIPVSFVITVNDNFDERIIRFGDVSSNENHNNAGQSVTQKCRSYVFNISNGKKLRIIDTPGFGDTRGNQQDDLNMEEIFSFLHNIDYINAVCFLFKPEVVQLNPYLRACFNQLFDYFGGNIRKKLVFCFTNARSTFFTPGNTRPLLDELFDSLTVKNIGFDKQNTFCFDSESFRYLVAIQDGMTFELTERNEMEKSWVRSSIESKRFRDCLCKQYPYHKKIDWRSNRVVYFQIELMIRPILEACRNHLRNLILYNNNMSIKLTATHADKPMTLCYAYKRHPRKLGEFWIIPDFLHNSSGTCTSNEQRCIQYTLGHEILEHPDDKSIEDLKKELKTLHETCAPLSYFLMNNSPTTQIDRFLDEINRMIDQEDTICKTQTLNDLNKKLLNHLKRFGTKYQDDLNGMTLNNATIDLSTVYDLIESLHKLPIIKVQMDAIEKYKTQFIENNQINVFLKENDSE